MSIVTILWSMAAAACFAMAGLQILIWSQEMSRRAHLWIALAAVWAGLNAFAELGMMRATEIGAYSSFLRVSAAVVALLVVSMVWFVVSYFETARRWFAVAVTILWAGLLVLDLVHPYGGLFSRISSLEDRTLPWGESFRVASGAESGWTSLTSVAGLVFVAFVADASWRLWRHGGKRRALVVGGTMVLFLGAAAIHAPLVDLGLVRTPYLITFSFLGVVFVMGLELTREVVRASTLSAAVEASERRWRSLLENVRLLVVGVDRAGRVDYVNPFYTEVTGLEPLSIVGRPFTEMAPISERERYADAFEKALAGEFRPHAEALVRGRDGDERVVSWSNVLLAGPRAEATGTLSIGADITEQRRAEASRDEALARTRAALSEVDALRSRLEEEVVYLSKELETAGRFEEIVGNSDALRYVLQRLEMVAPLDTTVLIEGETGVGKELIARALHARSLRSKRPIVRVDCTTLPPSLIEAGLFGHERGAFTGAVQMRRGRFELADGGTIFLDEVGELPLELQGKLLRVLQEGEFERIGGATIRVDVRVIAATNRRLSEEVEKGRFREDLYYRLRVFPLTVPPLRQRRDDIPLLVDAFVRRFSQAQGKRIDRVPAPVMDELCAYDWPGNVRELCNVVERAVIQARDGTLRLAERLTATPEGARAGRSASGYRGSMQEVEREYVLRVLEIAGWKIDGENGAAKLLDLHPNTLRFRMGKLGIKRPVSPPQP